MEDWIAWQPTLEFSVENWDDVMNFNLKTACNKWAKYNINVNTIAPGYIVTDNTAPLRDDENRNRVILERIPAGRWGTPDDMKGAAVFLASEAGDYMQGHFQTIDGGWLARLN